MGSVGDIHAEAPPPVESQGDHLLITEHYPPAGMPAPSERAAINQFDGLNLDAKINRSPEQSDTLRKMEGSILRGDLGSLESALRKFKDNPESAQPIMNVLGKDMLAAGVRATYDVDSPLTSDGKVEKSGMLSLSTAKDIKDWFTGDNKTMCLYTNPKSKTWAEHEVGSSVDQVGPKDFNPTADLALREIGSHAAGVLIEKKVGD